MNREDNLDRVRTRTKPWDIIIIGGGATGVGCAVDSASRGYDVLLLEQHDFGKGTSSRSTKLIHGGVRYLEQGNIPLVREALKERGILLRNEPHVVHAQDFIVPCYGHWQTFYYGVGLKIYDLLSGKYRFGRSKMLSKAETKKRLPGLNDKGLSGGILYTDGQFDDTRLLIDLVKTANEHGADVLNYAKVISFTKNTDGNICGVEFEDAISGEMITASAKAIINATGAFCDEVRRLSDAASKPLVILSQGIHLVFAQHFLPGNAALMIPKTSDGRVLFCIPWHGHTLVGTTDTPIEKADLEPQALETEIDFVLKTARQYLTIKPTRDDILSIFTGIRPLVTSDAAKNTASISRGHTIEIDRSNLVTITGGKWTTYRQMAEDAIDQAVRLAGLGNQKCLTSNLRLSNAIPKTSPTLARLHPDLSYTSEDVLHAVRDEMAQTLEDVLARRTRALFLNAKAAIEMAPIVAGIMSQLLGKDERWETEQVEQFLEVADSYQRK